MHRIGVSIIGHAFRLIHIKYGKKNKITLFLLLNINVNQGRILEGNIGIENLEIARYTAGSAMVGRLDTYYKSKPVAAKDMLLSL